MIHTLERFLEWGGVKKAVTCLVFSGIALLVSIFDLLPQLPFDAAWAAVVLCGIPIILEAVIGLVTAFDIKADVLVSIALIASLIIGEDFAAGEVAFIMQLGALLEDLTVARARAGAEMNGLAEKTDFIARNLFTWSEDDWNALWERSGGIDRVLIDPPREGAQALAQVLAKTDKRPARVVYVSCNPATLARDCAILHHEGGWHIRAAGVMNMFPHTGHVESMAVLEPGPKPEKKTEEPVAAESLQTPETTAKDAASKVPEDGV